MVPTNVLESTKKYLGLNRMFVNEEWLTSCLEYVMENCSDSNITSIHDVVKEQWLLNDLRLICPGCLPHNLSFQEKTNLQGVFVLQINSVIDVGRPAYQQYLELQNVNIENIEATKMADQKVPAHRLLKLNMTDGVQDITGIEYKPIRNLHPGITPGIKALIKGPVECRRGAVLLTEKNFELLDGEVEDMQIINSQLSSIECKLGLPISMTRPSLSQSEPATITQPVVASNDVQAPQQDNLIIINDDDDDDFDETALNEIEMIEAQCAVTKRPSEDVIMPPEKKPKPELNIDNLNDNPTDFPLDDFNPDDLELDDFTTNDSSTNNTDMGIGNQIVCINTVNNFDGDKSSRTFKVKARILTLISKLSVNRHNWNLRCTLADDSGTIDVNFANEVLSKLVGYTPERMYEIKKQMNTQPELHEQILEALKKVKEELQTLHCIMEIDINEDPKVIKLIPI